MAHQKTGDVTRARVITLADSQPIQYKYARGNRNINLRWGPIVDLNNRHVTVEYRVDGTQLLADVVHYWRLPVAISH